MNTKEPWVVGSGLVRFPILQGVLPITAARIPGEDFVPMPVQLFFVLDRVMEAVTAPHKGNN